jgi:hypothetical protein
MIFPSSAFKVAMALQGALPRALQRRAARSQGRRLRKASTQHVTGQEEAPMDGFANVVSKIPAGPTAIPSGRPLTATGLVQAGTQRTKVVSRIAENLINKPNNRTP